MTRQSLGMQVVAQVLWYAAPAELRGGVCESQPYCLTTHSEALISRSRIETHSRLACRPGRKSLKRGLHLRDGARHLSAGAKGKMRDKLQRTSHAWTEGILLGLPRSIILTPAARKLLTALSIFFLAAISSPNPALLSLAHACLRSMAQQLALVLAGNTAPYRNPAGQQ